MSTRRLETPQLSRRLSLSGPDDIMLPGGTSGVVAELQIVASQDSPVTIRGYADPKPGFPRPLAGTDDPLVLTTSQLVIFDLGPTNWTRRP